MMKAEKRPGGGLYRVRHTATGLYVAQAVRHARMTGGLIDGLSLFLDRKASAAKAGRTVAGKIGDIWIALTGDKDIEIEPAEE